METLALCVGANQELLRANTVAKMNWWKTGKIGSAKCGLGNSRNSRDKHILFHRAALAQRAQHSTDFEWAILS
jgi:hypothetical protein